MDRKRAFSFLYREGDKMTLMEDETFEQVEFLVEALGDQAVFLTVRRHCVGAACTRRVVLGSVSWLYGAARHARLNSCASASTVPAPAMVRAQDGVGVTVEYFDGEPLRVSLTENHIPLRVEVRAPRAAWPMLVPPPRSR